MRRCSFFLFILLFSLILPRVSSPAVEPPAGKMLLPAASVFDSGTDAVLVIDVSGSMKQSDPDYLCKKAALDFIRELSLSGHSRAALVTFSDTLVQVIPLTDIGMYSGDGAEDGAKPNDIVNELNALAYTAGDTDIGAAMEKAMSLLMEDGADDARARSIFLLTDGEIDLPCAEDEEAAEKESLTRSLMAVEQAKENGVVIHTVTLDLSGGIDENLMNYMADSTGGTSSRVNNAAALDEVFQALSACAARQAQEKAKAFSGAMAETEAETEAQTETETETETEAVFVRTVGSIDDPVRLKALVPNLCSAELALSDLFRLEGAGAAPDAICYTAYSDDSSILSCTVDGDILRISGLCNGSCRVDVIAQPEDAYMKAETTPQPEAQLSFRVQIHALIPSLYYLALVPAAAALIFLIIILLRKAGTPRVQLSGRVQWYVRGENEKIFGIPSQTMADLGDYGSKVRLSELVQDDLMSGADLGKVTISALQGGIRIASRSPACLIALSGCEPDRCVEMTESGRFRVLCETGSGRACVIAYYASDNETAYKTEPSAEDDSDERTRLLV